MKNKGVKEIKAEVETGRLVRSLAGRDKGRHFLILDTDGPKYVMIIDGALRKLEKPKKKKLTHLYLCPQVARELAPELKNGTALDSHVRRAIKSFID